MTNRITSFTSENARQMQQGSVLARRNDVPVADITPDEQKAIDAVKKLILDVLIQMRRSRSVRQMERLSLVLARLWKLVYPSS
jgi:hypothetical protein